MLICISVKTSKTAASQTWDKLKVLLQWFNPPDPNTNFKLSNFTSMWTLVKDRCSGVFFLHNVTMLHKGQRNWLWGNPFTFVFFHICTIWAHRSHMRVKRRFLLGCLFALCHAWTVGHREREFRITMKESQVQNLSFILSAPYLFSKSANAVCSTKK